MIGDVLLGLLGVVAAVFGIKAWSYKRTVKQLEESERLREEAEQDRLNWLRAKANTERKAREAGQTPIDPKKRDAFEDSE